MQRWIFGFGRGLVGLMVMFGAATSIMPARASAGDCTVVARRLDSQELAFVDLVNGYREANGLGPLAIAGSLNRAALWMAGDMGSRGYFGHTDSVGRGPWQRSIDCGYPVAGGENLAAGTNQDSAAAAFALFKSSPSHNANMLLPAYREIGVARVFVPGSPYGWYWATEFGTVDSSAGGPSAAAATMQGRAADSTAVDARKVAIASLARSRLAVALGDLWGW